MIDCYKANENRLNDIMGINDLFNELVDVLNLEPVMPPFLLPYYYAKDSADDGISAFTLLNGGHITVHTFPHRECAFVDIMVDGYYDANRFKEILKKYFLFTKSKDVRTERRYLDTTINKSLIYSVETETITDFGPHTLARVDNAKGITLENIYDILDVMPREIGMLPISRPYVLKSSVNNPEYLSGMVLIAQSHIAFHYNQFEHTLFCDMFSCSFYKCEEFIKNLKTKFPVLEYMTIIRGSKHEEQIRNNDLKVKKLSKWKNIAR